jgi:di/tricarboxylate transporter
MLIWVLLLVTFQPEKDTTIAPVRPLKERFTGVQWFVSAVTIATIILWCFSGKLVDTFGDMGVIAIMPIVLFFGLGVLTKEDFNNFPWTIIILAAGGLSLGKAVKSSGLLHSVAEVVTRDMNNLSIFGVLVTFSTLVLVIATFISHTVAALIVLPLIASVGRDMEDPKPNLLVFAGVLICSAAMGLPTSGFPNMSESHRAPLQGLFIREAPINTWNSCYNEGGSDRSEISSSEALYQPGRAEQHLDALGCHHLGLWHYACGEY